MISRCANKATDFFVQKTVIDITEKDIYKYGFEMIFSVVVNLFWVVLAGILFNEIILSIVAFGIFATVRTQSGGYHADSYIKCNILLFIVFCFILILSRFFAITSASKIFFVLMFFYLPVFLWIYAPLPAKQHLGMTEEEKIKTRKKVVIRTVIWEFVALVGWLLQWKKLTVTVLMTLGMVCILLVIEKERRRKDDQRN